MSSVALEQGFDFHPLLEKVEQRLQTAVVAHNRIVGGLASRVIKAGGKRLRPLLVILFGWRGDEDWDPVIDVAAATELLHTASLIHDDIIDHADTRRGVSTLNAERGNHTAVMTGDYLFARSLSILSQESTIRAIPFMVEAMEAMCEGIIEEINTLYDHTVSEEDYLSRIDKKTASLVAACCGAGATIRGASQEEADACTAFGRNLGMCFQIIDDLLDFTSDEETLGKPTGSDFSQGILTLPVIYLLEHSGWREPIKKILEKRSCTSDDLSFVAEAADKTKSIQRAYRKAREFQEKAGECLSFIPTTPVHPILYRLTELTMTRKK